MIASDDGFECAERRKGCFLNTKYKQLIRVYEINLTLSEPCDTLPG